MNGPSDDGKTDKEFRRILERAETPPNSEELYRAHISIDPAQPTNQPSAGSSLRGAKSSTPRYRDADDFDKEVAQGELVRISHYDTASDYIHVEHQLSGRTYRMRTDQSEARKLSTRWHPYGWTLAVDPSGPISDATKVHVVHQGQPLCHFTSLRLVDWPKGHEQLSLDAVRQAWTIEGASCGANCNDCLEAARHLLEP